MKSPGGPPSQDDSNAFTIEAATKRFKDAIDRMLLDIPDEANENIDTQTTYIIDQLEERSHGFLPGHDDEVGEFIQSLRTISSQNKETMSQELASKIAQFFLDKITPEELSTRLRESAAERNKFTIVNELVSYGITKENLHLHISTQLDTKKPGIQEMMERKRLFEEGLHAIAAQLLEQPQLPEFEAVTKITGQSQIIFDYPQILKNMGFTITKRNEEKKMARAEISREDFVKRYS